MARPKKTKKAGDMVPIKLRNDEAQHIIDWFNQQSTIVESIRYLIEKDISENGLRDVKDEIRNKFSYFQPNSVYNSNVVETHNSIVSPPLSIQQVEKAPETDMVKANTPSQTMQTEFDQEGPSEPIKQTEQRLEEQENREIEKEIPSKSPIIDEKLEENDKANEEAKNNDIGNELNFLL
ncbi:hypothetical protein [Metabacillus fastidiosus]|uniref:hypothetical protein n=1 Tax=Metabacillus fastidiosus TaxID=1458 RepID=UPI003D2D3261